MPLHGRGYGEKKGKVGREGGQQGWSREEVRKEMSEGGAEWRRREGRGRRDKEEQERVVKKRELERQQASNRRKERENCRRD